MTGRGSRESSASGAAAAALASMAGIAAATASFAWARWSNWSIQRTDVEVASPRLTSFSSPATWWILARRVRRSRCALSPLRRASRLCTMCRATMSRVWTSIRR